MRDGDTTNKMDPVSRAESSQDRVHEMFALLSAGKIDQAKASASSLICDFPSLADPYICLYQLSFELGDLEKAVVNLRTATILEPAIFSAPQYLDFARHFYNANRYADAIYFIELSHEQGICDESSKELLRRSLIALGRFDKLLGTFATGSRADQIASNRIQKTIGICLPEREILLQIVEAADPNELPRVERAIALTIVGNFLESKEILSKLENSPQIGQGISGWLCRMENVWSVVSRGTEKACRTDGLILMDGDRTVSLYDVETIIMAYQLKPSTHTAELLLVPLKPADFVAANFLVGVPWLRIVSVDGPEIAEALFGDWPICHKEIPSPSGRGINLDSDAISIRQAWWSSENRLILGRQAEIRSESIEAILESFGIGVATQIVLIYIAAKNVLQKIELRLFVALLSSWMKVKGYHAILATENSPSLVGLSADNVSLCSPDVLSCISDSRDIINRISYLVTDSPREEMLSRWLRIPTVFLTDSPAEAAKARSGRLEPIRLYLDTESRLGIRMIIDSLEDLRGDRSPGDGACQALAESREPRSLEQR